MLAAYNLQSSFAVWILRPESHTLGDFGAVWRLLPPGAFWRRTTIIKVTSALVPNMGIIYVLVLL